MDYTTFKDFSEVPERCKTMVATRDADDDTTLIIKPMRYGRQIGDETVFGAADVDTDPMANIKESAKVYVKDDAEQLFNAAQEFSDIYNECNGNLESIAERLDEELCSENEFEDEECEE